MSGAVEIAQALARKTIENLHAYLFTFLSVLTLQAKQIHLRPLNILILVELTQSLEGKASREVHDLRSVAEWERLGGRIRRDAQFITLLELSERRMIPVDYVDIGDVEIKGVESNEFYSEDRLKRLIKALGLWPVIKDFPYENKNTPYLMWEPSTDVLFARRYIPAEHMLLSLLIETAHTTLAKVETGLYRRNEHGVEAAMIAFLLTKLCIQPFRFPQDLGLEIKEYGETADAKDLIKTMGRCRNAALEIKERIEKLEGTHESEEWE